MTVGVLQRFDRRGRLGVPVVGRAGCLRADDAHRCALGIGGHGALGADREAKIDRAGDDRLQRLARPRRVDDFEVDAVLLEDAGLLAEIRNRRVPVAALADGELEEIGGVGRRADA